MNGTTYVYRPSVDALRSSGPDQQLQRRVRPGRRGDSEASIKSGGERFHGNVFEFHRNGDIRRQQFLQQIPGTEKGKFIRNQFGGTLVVPVVFLQRGNKKTFFFADYEGTTQRQAVLFQVNTPTALMQQSNFTNFSELLTQGGTRTDRLGRVFSARGDHGSGHDPSHARGRDDPMTGIRVPAHGNRMDQGSHRSVRQQHHPGEPDQPERSRIC